MREDVIRVVETYIDAVRRNAPDALPLHPDVVFESPLGRYQGLAAFQKGLADFFRILKSIEVVHLTADDDTCAAALKIDTIFGMIPFLEYFHVAEGQIVSIRAYYDPRPILQGMTQTSA
jgi:SnoaL-like domain